MKSQIKDRFEIKDLGSVKFFLSMLVERDRKRRTISLSQQIYLLKVLTRFSMENYRGCATPLDPKTKLHQRTEMEEAVNIQTYQEAVGSLTYAVITTRPDITYATSLVSRFTSNPLVLHW